MCSRVFILATALLVCYVGATGTGRSLQQVSTVSTSASASSTASASGAASGANGGTARAVAVSKATDGAKVSTTSTAVSEDGADVTAITVAEGTGDVVIDKRTLIVAAGETAKATVAVFVKKVADGITQETLEKEVLVILGGAKPFVLVRTMAVGLLEPGPIAAATISAAEALIKERGCEEFRKPFIGFSLPIARIEGGCGPIVNDCIFDKCPEACCTPEAKKAKTCGCSGDVCPWAKGAFSKEEYSPFFWKCKDCTPPADSCICA
ncbi:hypothetical protein BSKO_03232 [Bryopsis sp. KO-2023]|nr:hypothetical protein BSKO_03232 [Bryopsis sp. KO-2023]